MMEKWVHSIFVFHLFLLGMNCFGLANLQPFNKEPVAHGTKRSIQRCPEAKTLLHFAITTQSSNQDPEKLKKPFATHLQKKRTLKIITIAEIGRNQSKIYGNQSKRGQNQVRICQKFFLKKRLELKRTQKFIQRNQKFSARNGL